LKNCLSLSAEWNINANSSFGSALVFFCCYYSSQPPSFHVQAATVYYGSYAQSRCIHVSKYCCVYGMRCRSRSVWESEAKTNMPGGVDATLITCNPKGM
jgi:hypothetical protein